jgi:hypothetical protein
MRRLLPLACLPALAFGPAAAEAAAAYAPASVKLADCVQTAVAGGRSATFEARARATAGSERMQVRFTLQARADAEGGGWRRVAHPALDEWLGSAPGVRKYSFTRTVRNLSAPAAYRAVVRFRWLDEEGDVLKSARAVSPVCRQPDLRPDLVATAVDVQAAADAGTSRYAVTVRNDGRTAAGAFSVGVRAGDLDLDELSLPGLAAGESRTVSITGPACVPGDPLNVTVDSGDEVDERGEDNNLLAATCPPPVTSSPGPARSRA